MKKLKSLRAGELQIKNLVSYKIGFLLILIFSLNANSSTISETLNDLDANSLSEESLKTFGHSLSNTSSVLKSGQCSLGLQATACGLTDDLSIGSSPWLWLGYNMSNLFVRQRVAETEKTQHAFQLGLFKTFEVPVDRTTYDMEGLWLSYIQSFEIEDHYTLHINYIGNYYTNDRRPFSLRRPTVNRNPFQFNLSSLHEVKLSSGLFLLGELGVLGATEKYPHLHTGASLQVRAKSFLVHIGFTMTSTLTALFSPSARYDYHSELISYEEGLDYPFLDEDLIKRDFSIHPEFALQYFFDVL